MKIRIDIFLLLLAALYLQACKKKDLEVYDQGANGASIYFKEAINAKQNLRKTISFGFSGYSVHDSVVAIPIAVTGSPSLSDRVYQLRVTDSTTASPNTHYSFVHPAVVRVGKVVDTLHIRIKRTADMSSKQYRLSLALEQNDMFNTKLNGNLSSYTTYDLLLDDMVGVSYLWTTYSRRTTILSYFGAYSRQKVNLMMEVLKIPPEFFYDPAAKAPTSTQIVSYSRYMFYWLNKEAAEGRVYKDENGMEIQMGQLSI